MQNKSFMVIAKKNAAAAAASVDVVVVVAAVVVVVDVVDKDCFVSIGFLPKYYRIGENLH